jgi:hypothetical protein
MRPKRGADVKPEEVNPLVGFLVRYYGESVEINKATAQQLQDELDMTPVEAEVVVKARAESGNFKAMPTFRRSKDWTRSASIPLKIGFATTK